MRQGGIAVAVLTLLAALGGCNPLIGAYRNMRGLSQDDPNPMTAPNAKNFAHAETEPYPNLATVPPPPSDASSAAARTALMRDLTRSRTRLEATDRTLRAGGPVAFAPPPSPPPLPPAAAAGNPPAPSGRKAKAGPSPRRSGQPPLPGPRESPLVSPRIAALPQPEAGPPAPAAPHLAPAPVPAPPALPAPAGSVHEGGAAIAAAGFQPAPAPPRLAPLAPPPPVPAGRAKPSTPTAPVKLAEIRFPANATNLAPEDRAIVAKAAAVYRRRRGTLRVVGFAGGGGDARHQLDSFRAALDRAQAVAAALGKAGVPSARIRTEAAPAGAGSGTARAEILLEP